MSESDALAAFIAEALAFDFLEDDGTLGTRDDWRNSPTGAALVRRETPTAAIVAAALRALPPERVRALLAAP